jgi:Cof subfamily protein (haloacid dehalogenase superfamily)
MQKSQAIIIDIDGTAIDSPTQKLPTERLNNAVRAIEDKFYICAATGRTWSTGKPVFQGMSLTDPCVISGGTQICDPRSGRILWQCNINEADVKTIRDVLLEHPGYGLIINDFSQQDYESGGIPVNQVDINQEIYFMIYTYVPLEEATAIANRLRDVNGVICLLATSQKAGYKDIHITNNAATKEHAVAELLARIGVDSKNTWGFGDALNDIHLFNAVHTKVAMGNAVQELKDLADEVIAPVNEDGLAQYFERLA